MSTPVYRAIAEAIAEAGITRVFGLVGSGNLHVSNALTASGIEFVTGNHESAVVGMADGFARVSRTIGVATVHQGPGLTNAVTSIAEAVKSGTPLVVLAADTATGAANDNLDIDQDAIARAAGAVAERLRSAATARQDIARALRRARRERTAVVFSMPIDLQAQPFPGPAEPLDLGTPEPAAPSPDAVAQVVELIRSARRPVILAGRGAAVGGSRAALETLAERSGALLSTSAVAKGLFTGNPFDIGFSGGFALPHTRELLSGADLVLAFGVGLNSWTLGHGAMLGDDVAIVHIDIEESAFDRHHPADVRVLADATKAAEAIAEALGPDAVTCYRDDAVRERIAAGTGRLDFDDESTPERIDQRTLLVELEQLLPQDKTVVTDGGHFQGFPPRLLSVSDDLGFIMPIAFQSIGLGLGTAMGAALGRPERLTVLVAGDGGFLMSSADLDTAVRHRIPLLIVIVNDAEYGAETHVFEPLGENVDLVRFPDRDFAAIAAATGARSATVTEASGLAVVSDWLRDPAGPLVLDCKVNPQVRADYVAMARHAV